MGYTLAALSILAATATLSSPALAADSARLSTVRVRTTCYVQLLIDLLVPDLTGRSLSVTFEGSPKPARIKVVERVGQGLGAGAYVVELEEPGLLEAPASGVIAKVSHTTIGRKAYLNRVLDEEYAQFLALQSWAGGEQDRLPVARILAQGRLEDGSTVLFKQRIVGSPPLESAGEPTPQVIAGLRRIYDLAQILYRDVTVAGKPFMLDIYPSNLIWVEKPEDLALMGLKSPGFLMPEASSMKEPIFVKDYSFEQFISDYKTYRRLQGGR